MSLTTVVSITNFMKSVRDFMYWKLSYHPWGAFCRLSWFCARYDEDSFRICTLLFGDGVIKMANGCTRTGIWWYIYSSRKYDSKLLWQIYGSIFDKHTQIIWAVPTYHNYTGASSVYIYICISHLLCSYQMPYSYHVELLCSLLS